METDFYNNNSQTVENFLRLARNVQSKNQFMVKVRQFDQRFIDAYPTPKYTESSAMDRQNSGHFQSFPPHPPTNHQTQPIKNPFVTNQQHFSGYMKANQNGNQPRTNNFIQNLGNINGTQQQFYQNVGNKIPHIKSEENFYKLPQQSNANSRVRYENTQQNMHSYANLPSNKQFQHLQNQFTKHYVGQKSERQPQNSFPVAGSTYPYAHNFQNEMGNLQYPSIISNMGELQQHQKNNGIMGVPLGNQFLGGLNQQPDYVKYFKKTVNAQGKQSQGPTFVSEGRVNPFSKN